MAGCLGMNRELIGDERKIKEEEEEEALARLERRRGQHGLFMQVGCR